MNQKTRPHFDHGESMDPFAIADDPWLEAYPRRYGIPLNPPTFRWSLACQGALVELIGKPSYSCQRKSGKRARCLEFTNGARLRLLKEVAIIDWKAVGVSLFVTLTYPPSYGDRRMRQRTQDRSQFMRAVERILGRKVASIWRIEWEERKSGETVGNLGAHYHLLLLGVQWLDWEWIRDTWSRIIGCCTYVHTYVERTDGGAGAARYVAKYCAKRGSHCSLVNASYLNRVGRHWGMTRKTLIQRCIKTIQFGLADDVVRFIQAAFSAVSPCYDHRYDTSGSLLGDKAVKFISEMAKNGIDAGFCERYTALVEVGAARGVFDHHAVATE